MRLRTARLGGAIYRAAGGEHLYAENRSQVDDVTALLPPHVGQSGCGAAGLNLLTIVLRRSLRRAPRTTAAPSVARCRATLSSRPLLAPVITTTFPSMFLLIAIPPRGDPVMSRRN